MNAAMMLDFRRGTTGLPDGALGVRWACGWDECRDHARTFLARIYVPADQMPGELLHAGPVACAECITGEARRLPRPDGRVWAIVDTRTTWRASRHLWHSRLNAHAQVNLWYARHKAGGRPDVSLEDLDALDVVEATL